MSLRNDLIHVAHNHPETQKHLLPLLKEAQSGGSPLDPETRGWDFVKKWHQDSRNYTPEVISRTRAVEILRCSRSGGIGGRDLAYCMFPGEYHYLLNVWEEYPGRFSQVDVLAALAKGKGPSSYKRGGDLVASVAQRYLEAQYGDGMSLEDLRDEMVKIVRHLFPQSPSNAQIKRSPGRDAILLSFALWPKSDWPNGIIHNDPSYTQIWLWDAAKPRKSLDMSLGNRLYGYNGTVLVRKVGFRKVNGNANAVLRGLQRYFEKLQKVVLDNQEALDEALIRYRSR